MIQQEAILPQHLQHQELTHHKDLVQVKQIIKLLLAEVVDKLMEQEEQVVIGHLFLAEQNYQYQQVQYQLQ